MPVTAIKIDDAFFEKLLSDDLLARTQFRYWLAYRKLSAEEIQAATEKFMAVGDSDKKKKGMALALLGNIDMTDTTKLASAKAFYEGAKALGNAYAIYCLSRLSEDVKERSVGLEEARRLGSPEASDPLSYNFMSRDYNVHPQQMRLMAQEVEKGNNLAVVTYIYDLTSQPTESSLGYALKLCEEQMRLGNPYAFEARAYMHNKGFKKFGTQKEIDSFTTQAEALGCAQEKIRIEAPIDKITPTVVSEKAKKDLLDSIEKLRAYGQRLIDKKTSSNTDRDAGFKAVQTALELEQLASRFLNDKTPKDEKVSISSQFKKELQTGYDRASTHRTIWKPILLNILIAATGVGLIFIAFELADTGKGLFFDTTRGSRIKDIDRIFRQLDQETFKKEDGDIGPLSVGLD